MEDLKIVEVTSARGKKMLVVNGYKFAKQREAYNMTKWRCVRTRQLSCHATFYTGKGDKVIHWKDNNFEHTHTARNSVQMVRDQVLNEIQRKLFESEPVPGLRTRTVVDGAMESIDWTKMPPLTEKEQHYVKQSLFYACQYRMKAWKAKSTNGIPHHHARKPEMGIGDIFEAHFCESDSDDIVMKVGEDTDIIPMKPRGQCTSESCPISRSDSGTKNPGVRRSNRILDKSKRPPKTTDEWLTNTELLFVSPTVIPLKEVFSKQDELSEAKTKTSSPIKRGRPRKSTQPGVSNSSSSSKESIHDKTDSRQSASSDFEGESDDTDRNFILSLLPKYRKLTPADKSMFRAQALQLLQWKLKGKE